MEIFIVNKSAIKWIFMFLFQIFNIVDSTENAQTDEITNLPGLNYKINFKQYSGYLNAGEGKLLHYWFVESQSNPVTDPVVLWLNGGPGCSSIDGFLSEIGPFRVKRDGETLYNAQYSWNRISNVIFLESPAGVGYSYSSSKNYSTDDDLVAYNNYVAIDSFFEKYPHLRKNEFFITGESYAGVYIPTLALRILKGKSQINFKGIAIGNGSLNEYLSSQSLLFFGYYHGLIGIQFWENVTKNCCSGIASQRSCTFTGTNIDESCWTVADKAVKRIHTPSLNIYNILKKCFKSDSDETRYELDIETLNSLFPSAFMEVKVPTVSSDEEEEEEEVKRKKKSAGKAQCTDTDNITHYMNLRSVREALHVPDNLPNWMQCRHEIHKMYAKIYKDLKPLIIEVLNYRRIRVLIFAGDLDTVCNYLGNEWFVDSLNLELKKDHAEWRYKNQIGGFVKYYQNLTFMTFKGAGHMVPHDRAAESFQIFAKFLRNEEY